MAWPRAVEVLAGPPSAANNDVPKFPPFALDAASGACVAWVTTGTEKGAVGCAFSDEHATSSGIPSTRHAAFDMVSPLIRFRIDTAQHAATPGEHAQLAFQTGRSASSAAGGKC